MTMHHKPKCQPNRANDNHKLMPLQRCMLFYFTLDGLGIIKGTKIRTVIECGLIVLLWNVGLACSFISHWMHQVL